MVGVCESRVACLGSLGQLDVDGDFAERLAPRVVIQVRAAGSVRLCVPHSKRRRKRVTRQEKPRANHASRHDGSMPVAVPGGACSRERTRAARSGEQSRWGLHAEAMGLNYSLRPLGLSSSSSSLSSSLLADASSPALGPADGPASPAAPLDAPAGAASAAAGLVALAGDADAAGGSGAGAGTGAVAGSAGAGWTA